MTNIEEKDDFEIETSYSPLATISDHKFLELDEEGHLWACCGACDTCIQHCPGEH